MNLKTTALLLLLLLGSAGLYLGTRSGPGSTAPPAVSSAPVGRPLVSGQSFRRLVIERGGANATRQAYQLDDGAWWQVQPVRFPVQAAGPEAVINAALSLSPRQTLTPRDSDRTAPELHDVPTRAELGLGPEADRVAIVSGDTVFNLVLGRREVAGTAWLAIDGADGAFLVDPTLHDAVDAAVPAAWRPPTLPGPAADTVGGLTLEQRGRSADENAMMHRGPSGWHWGPRPDTPKAPEQNARADREAANQLAALTQGLPIGGYVTDDPQRLAELGLTHPAATLTLRLATAAPSAAPVCTLRLGRPADGSQPPARYATASFGTARSSVVFLVSGSSVAPLLEDPAALRDRRLVTADPASVTGLRVDRVDSGTIALVSERVSGAAPAVRFVQPNAQAHADPHWGAAWISLLHRTRADAFAPAPPEAQAPIATATLQLAADRIERVRIYKEREGRTDVLLAVRENEPIAAVVPADTLAPLLAPAITLRATTLPAPRSVTAIRLTRDDGVVFAFDALEGDAPSLQADGTQVPTAKRWDVPALRQLQHWLQNPRAVQWTPRAELPRGPVARLTTGPDAPAYSVNVRQNLAQRTDLPGVFRIAPDIAALFNAEYRPRVLIDARADELTALSLQHPGSATATGAEPLGLRDRLAGLRAQRWLPAAPGGHGALPPAAWSLRVQADTRHWTLEHIGPDRWRINDQPVSLFPADAQALDAAVDMWNAAPAP